MFPKLPDGTAIDFVALVPQFGSKKGMLLLEDIDWARTKKAEANDQLNLLERQTADEAAIESR